jgi:hypothetical protein
LTLSQLPSCWSTLFSTRFPRYFSTGHLIFHSCLNLEENNADFCTNGKLTNGKRYELPFTIGTVHQECWI